MKAKRIASHDKFSVLIEGETGTGKELFAQAIHNASVREKFPFVAFNVAALSENLVESELFGYEEGAFTGAKKGGKKGLFEKAHSGTIFLDEIDSLPLKLQTKLLRVIQEKEIIKVGGENVIPIDIRVLASVRSNIKKLIACGKFRDDLYYRLCIFPLKIPPLRERKDDIPMLINYFLDKRGIKKSCHDIPKAIMHNLLEHDWPGNIRELENKIDYLIAITEGLTDYSNVDGNLVKVNKVNKFDDKNVTLTANNISANEHYLILEIIHEAEKKGKKVGRGSVRSLLQEKYNVYLSDQQVKTRMQKLAKENLIISLRGRAGSKITSLGKKYLLHPESFKATS